MLLPAMCCKNKLKTSFSKEIYTQDWFLYADHPRFFNLSEINSLNNVFAKKYCNTSSNEECDAKPKLGQFARYNCANYKKKEIK